MKKKGNIWRFLACLLAVAIFFVTTAFSLRGETMATPDNPLKELQEESGSGKATMLSDYLPKSQEIAEELQAEEAATEEAAEEAEAAADTQDAEAQDKDSDNLSDEAEGTEKTDGEDGPGKGEDGEGGDEDGAGEHGTTPSKVKDGDDGEAQNYFTTSIVDGETVTEEYYSFTITQLQKVIPLVETLVFVNGQQTPQFNGKVLLEDGKNTIKITCTYQKESEKKFSVSRSYTVILDASNVVFFTNLEDGTTVNVPNYSFVAYAQYKGENVPLTVTVNGNVCTMSPAAENTYEVTLKDLENTIVLKAKDGSGKEQTQSYRVHMELKKAAILTDLSNLAEKEMAKPQLEFYASVLEENSGQEHPAKVTMNGKELSSSNYSYKVTLKEGGNVFTVDGTRVNPDLAVETYVVYYYAPAEGLEIRTDLEPEQTVGDASFVFYAYARDSRSNVNLTVTVNGKTIEGNRNHYYSVGLKKNDNSIVMTADNGQEKKVQEYTVTYEPKKDSDVIEDEEGDEPETEDPNAPTISSPDLYDGMSVKGSIKNFTLKAVDYKGRKLGTSYLTLKLNGSSSGISVIWDDSVKTSYRLKLKSGENELSIKVVDEEGHKAAYLIHITSESVGAGGVIGKVRFSIDAQVLGIGYLIEPVDVEIHDGENAAGVLDRVLAEKGFTYHYTGSLNSGFYLSHIMKAGLLKDLDESMKKQYDGMYSEDSLGEFDFTRGSGWMYSVDGDFPNYGFADCYLQDGQEVRVQFTLDLGQDIGGGMALGGQGQ